MKKKELAWWLGNCLYANTHAQVYTYTDWYAHST